MSPTQWVQGLRNGTTLYTVLRSRIRTGVMVLDYALVWPHTERREEFAAVGLQTQAYYERQHNARWIVYRARPKEDTPKT